MKELIQIENPNAAALFAPGGLNEVLMKIEAEARVIAPDASTPLGRKDIVSLANRIARSKTYLDNIGKEYVAELKRRPKLIDAERKAMRDRLDILKHEIRKPVDEFDAREASRVAAILDRISAMERLPLNGLKGFEINDSFEEFQYEAKRRLSLAIAEAEAQAARIVRDAAERKEREERIAAEARQAEREAQAQAEAEAAQAAIKAEESSGIRESIVASLTEYGVTKQVATAVVEAITKNKIPHLSVNY